MRILHMAPFNTAGVPMTFVLAERRLGHTSRLITLGRDRQNRPSDICLNLPFLDSRIIRFVKNRITAPSRLNITYSAPVPASIPIQWTPSNRREAFLIQMRERLWKSRIQKIMRSVDFWNFDLYQLDGGLEFYRDGRIIQKLKTIGKKVICCYTGSDLRTRGVIPEIDAIADLNISVEYDHLQFHPRIWHVPFPLEIDKFQFRYEQPAGILHIGHAPTNRKAKGSDIIIPCIQSLEKKYPVKLVLIENLSYQEALKRKRSCHIFIDQIGNLGYGMNAIEALAMGIPTCTSLAPGFHDRYPEHPFFEIDATNIRNVLTDMIGKPGLLGQRSLDGRRWVEKIHDSMQVVSQIHRLAGVLED